MMRVIMGEEKKSDLDRVTFTSDTLRKYFPKAAFYDLFIDLKHSTNLRTTAKELDVPERRFVRFLIERRFVYRTASGNVLPYANVKNAGLFCVKDY